ncbi:MAG: hypothetical protein JSV68_10140 [Anaerolineaceae bacterium]|nr:MAG: hypothetical protein JSV68_10140 [Anaerolineaceae bacterium]
MNIEPSRGGQASNVQLAIGEQADLEMYCSSVVGGEGRLLHCLEKNDKQVSGRCKEAFKEVGLNGWKPQTSYPAPIKPFSKLTVDLFVDYIKSCQKGVPHETVKSD